MRIPVTLIDVKGNCVIAVKTSERDHYQAVQLGFGIKKNATRAEVGHGKGAKRDMAPKFLKEVRILDDSPLPQVGSVLNPSEVFQPGDTVNVSGVSKGKGFAGVVKRHGFHGGPKTHGQSDRHRAPGAIGQGTTPGRVYRGKKMAGRMGTDNVTVRNLKIVDVTADGVLVVKGLVPGITDGLIVVKKVGEDKKFVPLYKEVEEVSSVSKVSEGEGSAASVAQDEASDEPKETSENSEKSDDQNVSGSENQNEQVEVSGNQNSDVQSSDTDQEKTSEVPGASSEKPVAEAEGEKDAK